jgi:hypothetical protein
MKKTMSGVRVVSTFAKHPHLTTKKKACGSAKIK